MSCWVHVLIRERCKMFSHAYVWAHGGPWPPWICYWIMYIIFFKFKSPFHCLIWNLSLRPHLFHLLCSSFMICSPFGSSSGATSGTGTMSAVSAGARVSSSNRELGPYYGIIVFFYHVPMI